jgi:hypothetical protein
MNTMSDIEYGSDRLKAVVIEVDGIKISIQSLITEKDIEFFKAQLSLAGKYISQSPIHSFKKVLSSVFIDLGSHADLYQKYNQSKNTVAVYKGKTKSIGFFFDSIKSHPAYITLIHELAHQFHHTLIKNSFGNKVILALFKRATNSKRQCELFTLPKIGDPLSNLRESWWAVKKGSRDEYLLTKIIRGVYYYENGKGDDTIFTKEEIIEMLACPSEYGASNAEEFFAEMVTLITLGLVKPSQQLIADKFMKIIEQDSI